MDDSRIISLETRIEQLTARIDELYLIIGDLLHAQKL
jgi:hypothetical protein